MMNVANTQSLVESNFDTRIFFYCRPNEYQHLSICLAEGLKQLNVPFYSNINYFQIDAEQENYLFHHDPTVFPDDCDIVVVEKAWVNHLHSLPENLFHPGRNYVTVYLDDMDGLITPAWYPTIQNFDFIFRTHLNSQTKYPPNFVPWVFGLSNRILKETGNLPNFQHRTLNLLANFRVSQENLTLIFFGDIEPPQIPGMVRIDSTQLRVEHPLRQVFLDQFCSLIEPILPIDDTIDNFNQPPSHPYHALQWQQTGRRHHPNYYQRLKATAACAAFGGYVVPGTNGNPPYLEWWDSWRFWESLAAGCVMFHVDLEKYGAVLPVMLENWQHYIGIDLDNLEDTVHRIATDPGILEHISQAGRQWAIENYSPVPTAMRFLETIKGKPAPGDRMLWQKDYSLNNSLPIQLSAINFIIFPDWSQDEESIGIELQRVIGAIANHPDFPKITLLIYTNGISEEDANLLLSGVAMNLLIQDNLDVEDLKIFLVEKLDTVQWEALLPRIQARIILKHENQEAISHLELLNNVPTHCFYPYK
jgi:hypothetical protein